ncbi:hypothetical protein CSB09_04415 [Candidatus Gracilibacteria bacterium]|nr:MAG: hypothetical protein CSB09_04415 [Candidatus Gracilibacteria bacterium]
MAPQNDPLQSIDPVNENGNVRNTVPEQKEILTQPGTPVHAPNQETHVPQGKEVDTSENRATQKETSSIVDAIIAEANESEDGETQNTGAGSTNNIPPVQNQNGNESPNMKKAIRKPVSKTLVLQYIGSLLLIFTIVFGAFITYIVFNPGQSVFFITIFGINPTDVAILLKNLVNGSFGVILFVLSVIWIITLFRAIWTPKKYKRKRLFNWFLAGIVGIIVFSLLGLWAYLFAKIDTTNFANPGGNILAYDNDLYIHPDTKKIAQIDNFNNLIGPITLRYNISENAERLEKSKAVKIQKYYINFDGAKCNGDKSVLQGTNPTQDEGIICTFDEIRNYNIRGTYTVLTQLKEEREIEIEIEPIEIKGVLDIKKQKNTRGEDIITYDTTPIQNLGSPEWRYASDVNKVYKKSVITETVSQTPVILCLTIFPSSIKKKKLVCDRTFFIQDTSLSDIKGNITALENPAKEKEYTFALENLNLSKKDIVKIDWIIDGVEKCPSNELQKCVYAFTSYGNHEIKAKVHMVGNEIHTFELKLPVIAPLNLAKHVKISTIRGKKLNTKDTFDTKYKAYIIKNIEVPSRIILDARDVISENLGYELSEVNWTIIKDGKVEKMSGKKVEYTIERIIRHTIIAEYIFKKRIPSGSPDDVMRSRDTVYVNLERGNLVPILKVSKDSDYVPVTVTVDASQSKAENSEIIKFEYDFGEGRPISSGDGIKKYTYTTPGEKTITLTMINEAGERATTKKNIILKSTPQVVKFTTSLSPATVGNPVDFIAEGTNGQVESYIWNFGDNSNIQSGYDITHTFEEAGNYEVTLTVRYTDGTEDSLTKTFTVVESLE